MTLAVIAGLLAMLALSLWFAHRDDRRREDAWLRGLDEDRAKVRTALGRRREPVVDLRDVEDQLTHWHEREKASPLDTEAWR